MPTRRLFTALAVFLSLAGPSLGLVGHAIAADTTAGDITVVAPFARATPGSAKAGIAYLTVRNAGGSDDTLVAASADVAKRVELHTHINDNGIMRMREVESIPVPAGGMAELKPGGYHIMFMGLKAPFKEGESFPVTLTFEKAGKVTVSIPVMSIGAMSGAHSDAMDHGTMKMD